MAEMDKSGKIKKLMTKVVNGKLKGPDDRSPKRLLELMAEYTQAGKTPVDDAAFLSQICVLIRDLTNAKELTSMVPKLEKELVNSGGLKVLREFMHRICKVPRTRDEDWDFRSMLLYTMLSCYYLMLMLTKYSQSPIWTHLVQEGFPRVIADDLIGNFWPWKRDFKEYGADNIEEMGPMIGLSLLENCVDVNAFPREMVKYVTPMLDHYIDERYNDIEFIILAISLNYKLNPVNTIHKLLFTTKVFKKIAEFLNHTSVRSESSSSLETHGKTTPDFSMVWVITLKSLLNCLLTLTFSDDYKCHTILALKKCDTKLDDILKNGSSTEKELLKKLFQLLCMHSCSKCSWSYIGDLLLKHGIVLAPADPKSLKVHLPDHGAAVMERGRFQCQNIDMCHIFLKMLDMDDEGVSLLDQYLDPDFHRCFCDHCMAARQDQLIYDRGNPPKIYALPRGWAKFALKVPPRAVPWHMFQDWHMAFHGTTAEKLQSILKSGKLRMKGDIEHGSRGRDVEVFYVSPSILYAELDSIPPKFTFKYDPSSKTTYSGRVALQVRIDPNSYKVQKGRHRLDKEIDQHFQNTELEWATTRQDRVIIVGILIRVTENH